MFTRLFRNWLTPRKTATVARRVRPQLEKLEDRWAPAQRVWDGGALFNDNWRDNRNWEGNIAPVTGDELYFPASVGSTDKSTFNDFGGDTRFAKITVEDGYTLTGAAITVGAVGQIPTVEVSGNVSISLGVKSSTSSQLFFTFPNGGHLTMSGRIGGQDVLFGSGGTVTLTGSVVNNYTGKSEVVGALVLAKPAGVTAIPGALEIRSSARVDVFNSNQIPDSNPVDLRGTLRFLGVAETLNNITVSNGKVDLTNGSVVTANALIGTQQIVLGSGSTLNVGTVFTDALSVGTNSIINAGDTTLDSIAEADLAAGSVVTVDSLLLRGGVTITGQGALALNGNLTSEVHFFTPLELPPPPVPTPERNLIANAELRLGNATRTFNTVKVPFNFQGVDFFSDASLIVEARITSRFAAGLIKEGPGQMTIAGDQTNSYTGITRVNHGSLWLQKADSRRAFQGPLVVGTNSTTEEPHSVEVRLFGPDDIPDDKPVTVNRTGQIFLFGFPDTSDSIPDSETIGPLTLQGGRVFHHKQLIINGNITTLASDVTADIETGFGTLIVGAAGTTADINVADGPAAVDLDFVANVGGDQAFRKIGAGTLQLAYVHQQGGPSAAGSVILDTGTLLLSRAGQNATPGIPNVIVNGGTLDGIAPHVDNLTANAGTVTGFLIPNVAHLKVGATFFVDVFSQTIVTSSGTTVSFFNDTIRVRDNLFLGETATGAFSTLDFQAPITVPIGITLKIVDITSATGTTTGKFKTPQGVILNEGSAITTSDGQTFVISYVGGIGNNDVVLTRDTPPMFPNRSLTPVINEGGLATLTGTISEPDAGDTFFLDVNWGDGTVQTYTFPPGSNGQTVSVTHQYLDNGKYDVHVLWRDQHGGRNSATLQVQVNNVAPELADLRFELDRHHRITLTGRIVDPGRDSYTLVVHWGDGDKDTYHFRKGTTHFEVHHRYDDPGRYKVRLNLSDDDGGQDRESMILDLASRGRRDDAWWIALFEFLRD